MLISNLHEEDLTVDIIDKLLFHGLEDSGETADFVLVLGSMKAAKYRVPVAADIYKTRRTKKLVLCGGKLREFPDGKHSEAENMCKAALELGVNQTDIILENASINTAENIQFAYNMLQENFGLQNIHSIILVTTAYHMRRSLMIARNILPAQIKIIPCPANDTNTKRENWMNTPVGIARAKGEAIKIINYVQAGIIPDFEV